MWEIVGALLILAFVCRVLAGSPHRRGHRPSQGVYADPQPPPMPSDAARSANPNHPHWKE